MKRAHSKESLSHRIRFNYLFFASYFVVIAAVHVLHVFLIEQNPTFSRSFFLVYTLLECAIETLSLALITALFRKILPRFFYQIAVGLIFILFLGHLIDFPLERLMDMSFWFALHFVSQESYENFIELLYASNVSLAVWFAAFLFGLGVIFSGVWIFRSTEKWSDRRAAVASFPALSAITGILLLCLTVWDSSLTKKLTATQLEIYQKTLPWKTQLVPIIQDHLVLEHYLKLPKEEDQTLRSLDSRAFSLARKPDIYLFVIESLREDFITEAHSPNIYQFKQDHIAFDLALSNSNATQISWFSLFFSEYPFYWGKITPNNWNEGSVPLRSFKKMGYDIHAFSSARLGYYQMDHLIFGKTQYLADTLFTPDEEEFDEPYQRDQIAMEKLLERMDHPEEEGGRLFIVFLDATHLDYSWPKEECSLFHPFEEKINYFKVACSNRDVEKIQNRYRNSLYFVDKLMGQFFEKLESCPGGKEAVVILTADHGEEFYENGHLFHASGLTHQQTHIPLYYRFGSDKQVSKDSVCKVTCHMDIFPTLFHYLLGEDLFAQELKGQSIFKADRSPYIVACRFNASRPPYEFFIHNGKEKIIARFDNERDIFRSKKLNILSKKNINEENVPYDLISLKELFTEATWPLYQP